MPERNYAGRLALGGVDPLILTGTHQSFFEPSVQSHVNGEPVEALGP